MVSILISYPMFDQMDWIGTDNGSDNYGYMAVPKALTLLVKIDGIGKDMNFSYELMATLKGLNLTCQPVN